LQPEEQCRTLSGDRFVQLPGQLDNQARPLASHRAEPVVSEDRAQIVLQLIDEAPLVTPFERDFVVSSNQVTHRGRFTIAKTLLRARVILFTTSRN
jgi:hypothetical protein